MELKKILNEIVQKQELEYVNGKLYDTAIKMLLGSIKANNIKLALPMTRVDSFTYLAKASNNEKLLPLIQRASMSKDFTERNSAQKQLLSKTKPLSNWLQENLFTLISDRKRPKVSKNRFGSFVIEYKNEGNKPYIKFVRNNNNGFDLVSFHDNEYSFKKKAFNDTNSWKFGSKEVRDRIRGQN